MNQTEEAAIRDIRREIHDLRESIDRKVKWSAGLLLSIIMSLAIWVLDHNSRNIATAEIASAARETARVNTVALASNNRELGILSTEIKAQGRTLEKIERSLAELSRSLVDGSSGK